MKHFQLNFSSGLSATKPTNSPEERAAIFEAGMALSNCLEWLIDVSNRFTETLCLSCIIFPKRSDNSLEVSPITGPLMILPVMSYNYRYGFNSKENDDEVKGESNQINYGARVYDPRIARFLSVDPIQKKYAGLTPYQYASNSPIENIDIDGLEKYSIHYKVADGKYMITKVETDNSIRYLSITAADIPIRPKVAEFIKEDNEGKFIKSSGDIPLKTTGALYM
jgi:RHS repeat-associated protein